MKELVNKIAAELSLNATNSQNAIRLLFDEECTIPFVARYRKEATGSMDEIQLRALRDRYQYFTELEATKSRYLKVVELHCKTKPALKDRFPEIQERFIKCQTKQELEDLYLPYKPKRRTRAQIAREKGLEPLLDKILAERASLTDLKPLAQEFVSQPVSAPEGAEAAAKDTGDEKPRVENTEAALSGASDILAERINEDAEFRSLVRKISYETGQLNSQKWEASPVFSAGAGDKKKKVNPAKYESYFDYKEPIADAASHRIMAVRRGEAEKVLKLNIEVDKDQAQHELAKHVLGEEPATECVREWIQEAVQQSYRRLMAPSIETEIRLHLKSKAEEDAISVFSKNLENLLLLPPLPGKTVMGVDPGLRTGSKLAIVSETGKLCDHAVVYPDPKNSESPKSLEARKVVADLLKKHSVQLVAIGNGTGSREINQLIVQVIKEEKLETRRVTVNEAGASVYSTDDIAIEEFPDLDPTIRSTISIARRLQDPLAELVKVDPRSIGVGQYQHDCNITRLNSTLKETVESCVNRVGVNVNTASPVLLSYVSGIGSAVAKNIVAHRDEHGAFNSRDAIKDVSGFGPRAFEQAAGFLRIPGAENPLDNSAVHPERYGIVNAIAEDQKMPLADFIGKKEVIEALSLDKYVSENIGMPTLLDISQELIKPGRDPREDGSRLTFSDHVSTIDDLKEGMKLKGTVSNVTNFGAFVDIGVHQDGLVHISELSDSFVKDPASVVSVGDVLDVYVIEVDKNRKRISLSCKQPTRSRSQEQGGGRPSAARQNSRGGLGNGSAKASNRPQGRRPSGPGNRRPRPAAARGGKDKGFSMDDLLKKFNKNS